MELESNVINSRPEFSVMQLFRTFSGGRVLMLVMVACGNFTFSWILTDKTSKLHFRVYSFSQLISLRVKATN